MKRFCKTFCAIFFFASCTILTLCMTSCKTHVPRGSVEELAAYMMKMNNGLWDGTVASTQDVQAETGFSLEIAKKQVFFFEYNPNLKKGKAKLEYVKKNGYMYILGSKFDAEVNGNYVMIGHGENPKKAQLIQTFKEF